MKFIPVLGSALLLATPAAMPAAAQTVEIAAVRETEPVASAGDSADDPAIWRDPADPAKSLIVATDKSRGLDVYDLTGKRVASAPAGLVNNVDLRAGVLIRGRSAILVGASDRTADPKGRIALYALETAPAGLRHLADVVVSEGGPAKVYGFCLWRRSAREVHAFVPYNDGTIRQYRLDLTRATPTATLVREVRLGSKTEGCVVDDRTGRLYVSEERVGVWRIDAAPGSRAAPVMFAAIDGVNLKPDIEGLAIVPRGRAGGFLVASSQNDNAYSAYGLESGRLAAHFRIAGSAGIDGVTDTDGLEFAPGSFGAPFDQGLFVVQDGDNSPANQNFKLVPGSALLGLLGVK
ncbi:MAG: phytase [Novosphingobium sp.]|nr:phytase [Novosphingobium sp.]